MADERDGRDGDGLDQHVDAVAAAPERILHYDNAMLLRILNQSVKYRFFNSSERTVDVVWMRTETDNKWYKQLPRRTFLDIETFAGHKWRFLDAQDGTPLLAYPGGSADFIASANFTDEDRLKRRIAVVTEDMSRVTLHKLAMRRLAQLLHPTTLQHYPGYLPAMLIIELADYFLQCTEYQAKLHPGVAKKRQEHCNLLNRIKDTQRSHFIEE